MPLHDDPTQAALYGYLAGIMDGEGTFGINKTQRTDSWYPSYNAYLCAGMTEREPMQMLLDAFSGSLSHGSDGLWRWKAVGRLIVLQALPILISYLHAKRNQARLLLDFCLDWQDMRQASPEAKAQEFQRREDAFQALRYMHGGAAATTKREGIREDEAIVCTHVKA